MTPSLECYSCAAHEAMPTRRCDCGEPLWFEVGAAEWPQPGDDRGMWSYTDHLPAGQPPGFPGAIGGTPIYRADGLLDADCSVRLKDETANPTGSFKDRGSAVGAAWALDHDLPLIGTVSHGNMARSVAATAAAVGLVGVVLVPADIPEERLSHIGAYGPTIVRVQGDYADLYDRSYSLEPGIDGRFVNSDDPLRVAGQKTLAYEIARAAEPDAVVLPVSSGGNASAVWKGFRELDRAGRLDAVPRLYLVQADACSPIADAFQAGKPSVTPTPAGDTVAYSIANADPPSGNRALAAVRETGGAAVAVTDDEIREAQRLLRRRAGVRVEPASATTLAGLYSLVATGAVAESETVVLVMTGTGLTEPPEEDVEPPTVAIDELENELPRLLTG